MPRKPDWMPESAKQKHQGPIFFFAERQQPPSFAATFDAVLSVRRKGERDPP